MILYNASFLLTDSVRKQTEGIVLKCYFFGIDLIKKMKKISEPKSLISSSTTRLGLSIINNLIHFKVGFDM